MPQLFLPDSVRDLPPFYNQVLTWIEPLLPPEARILGEFQVPWGRQVDLLILTKSGFYLLELKNIRYREIVVNGAWTDAQGRPVRAEKRENPYTQAEHAANSVAKWVRQHRRRIFDNHKMQQAVNTSRFKVYPGVVIPPDSPVHGEPEQGWAQLIRGPEDLQKMLRRSWLPWEGYELQCSDTALDRIPSLLHLAAIQADSNPNALLTVPVWIRQVLAGGQTLIGDTCKVINQLIGYVDPEEQS